MNNAAKALRLVTKEIDKLKAFEKKNACGGRPCYSPRHRSALKAYKEMQALTGAAQMAKANSCMDYLVGYTSAPHNKFLALVNG